MVLDLRGEQGVLKMAADNSGALIIVHGFKDSKPIDIFYDGLSEYTVSDVISSPNATIERNGDTITVYAEDFDACVIHLTK